ncbi:MAG: alpha/beta hydrolase [Saprospiraceae bacterium]|nr:alpha/beta hydrolase [Saprospiraceae bacterium]
METLAKHQILESTWIDSSPMRPSKPPAILPLVRFGFQTIGRLMPGRAAKIAFGMFTTPLSRAKHYVTDPILESARIFEVLYGKRILKCYEWGSGEKTILLVHGWESRGTAMRSLVPVLLERGFRVVAFDGPAHGNSEGKQTNLVHFAGAVRAVLNQIGGAYGIITHSFGGAATSYALSWLDTNIHIEKLVLIAVPASIKRIYESTVSTLGLPPSVARRFRKIMETVMGKSIETIDSPKTFNQMSVSQGLIVHDRQDPIVSFRSAEEVADKWDAAILLETKGYGHFRLMKNPDLIEWIGRFVGEDL